MAKLGINTGSAPNVGDGDTLLVGAVKINSNFDELYNFLGNGTNLNVGTWNKNSTGINTTLNVGIGTTNAKNSLTVSGNGSFTGVVTSVTFNGQVNSGFATITNITNINSTISNLTGTSATITTYFGTDLTVTNATSTNNNVTNLVSTAGTITKLNSTSGTVTNLTGTAATVTTFNSTNVNVTNCTLENLSITGSGATITNGNITNLTGTAGTITTLNSTNGNITNLTGTAGTITTFNSTNGTIVNGTVTNLTGTAGTITTLNSTDGIITNLTGTAGTITTLNSTNGTITTLNSTNSNITNLSGLDINYTGISTLVTITNTNIVSSGIITSTQFSVGSVGSAINITQDTISGPSEIIIDPSGVGDNTGSLRIKGDLYVDGSQFSVSVGDINLGDFVVGVATNAGTNLLLDGAGIGIGSTDIRKTILWNYNSDSLKFSENINIPSDKVFKIGDTEVLRSDQLTISNINSSGISTLTTSNITNASIISGVITNFTGVACTITTLSSQQLNVSGVSTLSNVNTVNGSTFFANQLSVSGVSTFSQTLYINNDTNFSDDVYFIDDKASNFGNSNSFKVYHASNEWPGGESSQVRDVSGTFPVIVGGKEVRITDETGLINYSVFDSVGVEIYQNLNVSGIVTATSFVGDGSGLTGVVGSGSGIVIKDSGSTVGTAGTIDFGDNLTVSAISSGVVTVTSSGGGVSSRWSATAVGIHTLSNVGIGTTNPTSALTVGGNVNILGVVTATNFSGNASSSNYATTSGIATYAATSGISTYATTAGIATYADTAGISTYAATSGISTYATTAGIATVSQNLTGSPNITVSSINSSGVTTTARLNVGVGGTIVTINNNSFVGIGSTNPTSKLTVAGNTSLETLNVSGVSTFSGRINAGTGGILFDTNSYSGSDEPIKLWVGNSGGSRYFTLTRSNGGQVIFNNDYPSGHNDHRSPTHSFTQTGSEYYALFNSGSVKLYHPASASGILDQKFETIGAGVTIKGTAFTNQLNVSGVSTFNNSVIVGGATTTLLVNGDARIAGILSIGTSSITLNGNNNQVLVGTGVTIDGSTGILSATQFVGNSLKFSTNNPTIVGTSGTVGEIKQIAGAPFFYDGSAWREFVLSSGTPVTVPADTEWDNVVFRATFDDNFTDAKFGATPVYVGSGATIVGAAVTIGTGAYRNSGAVGSGISYSYRSDYDFTGSWTIEFWMYVDSNPTYSVPLSPLSLFSMHSTTGIGTSGNWTLAMSSDAYGNKYISWYNQNSVSYKNGSSLYGVSDAAWYNTILDKWVHFALVREADNGSLHFYVNGTEQSPTINDSMIDNDILDMSGNGLHLGGDTTFTIGNTTFNSNASADVIFDDVRISCGVGTAGQRYNSIGISTYATFTPPTTQLPITGTLSSYVQPPGDKYGEITLGGSPTWRGTSGVTVTQQSSGNYRVSFASTYANSNDYYVLSQGMDQGFASYVGIARSTTHVDLSINKQSDDTAVNIGSLAVQIKNHI